MAGSKRVQHANETTGTGANRDIRAFHKWTRHVMTFNPNPKTWFAETGVQKNCETNFENV